MKSREPRTPPLTITMIPSNLPIFINDSSSSGLRRSGDRYNPITVEDYRPPQRRRTHRSGGRHHPISLTDGDIPIIIIPDSPDRSDLAASAAAAAASASSSASAASAASASDLAASASAASASAASASAASASASAPATFASASTFNSPAADPKGKRPIIAPDPDAHCDICMDEKYSHQLFAIQGCSHRYCTSCVSQYVTAKVEDNVASIRCPDPGCETGVLDPEMCRGILPPAVFERWGMALCEMLIGPMKLYCPYKDCSALLIDDEGEDGVVVTDAECPHCFRWFCVKCKVPWHTDFTCEQFQALGADSGSDDLTLMRMAKAEKWQRCPACSYYVEKTEGCLFVKCRCGTSFCYTCGTKTVRDHFCAKCTPNLALPLQFGQFGPIQPRRVQGQLIPPPLQIPTPGLRLQLGQVVPPPPQNFLPPVQIPQLQQEQLRQLMMLQEQQQVQLTRRYQAMLLQEQIGQQAQHRQ